MELESLAVGRKQIEFVKYESICSILELADIEKFQDCEVEVFEKIDGGNCQLRKVENETGGFSILGASRANFLKGPVVKRREWFGEFTRWMYNNTSLYNIPQDLILFGELSGNHTIQYTPENSNRFMLLDISSSDGKKFIPYDEARKKVKELEIQDIVVLDTLFKGKLSMNKVRKLLREPSKYYNGPKEGIVIKDYAAEPQQFAKILHPEFAEKRRIAGGQIDYLTPSRFRKAALRWLDEYDGESKPDESLLVQAVYEDILREEQVNCDLGKIRKRLKNYLLKGKLPTISEYLIRQ